MRVQIRDFNQFLIQSPMQDRDVEAWIVNTLKVRMVEILDIFLETEGKHNAKKVFLVPFFTIGELLDWVSEAAPEMRTLVFRELFFVAEDAKQRFGNVTEITA